jgi:hypothetical protein
MQMQCWVLDAAHDVLLRWSDTDRSFCPSTRLRKLLLKVGLSEIDYKCQVLNKLLLHWLMLPKVIRLKGTLTIAVQA